MDLISAILMLSLLAAVLAPLAGWWVRRGYDGIGSLVNPGDSGDWWRATMPWPRGVQEEDGVAWHIRDAGSPLGSPARWNEPQETVADAFDVRPIRLRSRIGLRLPPPPR
jgi:hypothetical protein